MAVLYRTNSQSRQIEEAMRRYGRKYTIVGGFSYYQRAEVKDIFAYLKLASSQTGQHRAGPHHQRSCARHRQDHAGTGRKVRCGERR